nr:gonadotropin I beta subunit, GTH I beta-subunit {N-terminal} [Micropogonias undulatus=Atlantic croakers, pituitary glands, Peptide Partial, 15 aa] [Micropogonias undulatus]
DQGCGFYCEPEEIEI